ncbi:cytochrome P450 [Schizophyllum commune]
MPSATALLAMLSNTRALDVATVALKGAAVVGSLLFLRGAAYLFNMLVLAPPFDPLRKLPGPKGTALQNHFRQVLDPQISVLTHRQWTGRYGKMFRFHGFGKHDYRLMTFDLRAVSHILNSPIYEKPWQTRSLFTMFMGRGVTSLEGAEHKLQRRVMSPAFSLATTRAMRHISLFKAAELRDRLLGEVHPASAEKASSEPIDIAHWISRAAFDVLGLAAFDYSFDALKDETEPVYRAYRRMFNLMDNGTPFVLLKDLYFPWIGDIFPDERRRTLNECQRIVRSAGQKVIDAKKAAILEDKMPCEDGKDLLSLMIKSNLSSDPSKRMSDADLLDQITAFIFGGSDPTFLAIAWCLHMLSHHPQIQERLRRELEEMVPASPVWTEKSMRSDDIPDSGFEEVFPAGAAQPSEGAVRATCDAIERLPYLDAVVQESLRLCPPFHGTIRVATQDDVIPVSSPVVLKDGTIILEGEGVEIRKGSYIHIPIEGLNQHESIWGVDARDFNPDRWSNLPETARRHPGLQNLMTFSFGPHSCPGFRFAISQMKIFLATLLPHFTFKPADGVKIVKYNSIVTKPYVSGKWELGMKMPMLVEPRENREDDA